MIASSCCVCLRQCVCVCAYLLAAEGSYQNNSFIILMCNSPVLLSSCHSAPPPPPLCHPPSLSHSDAKFCFVTAQTLSSMSLFYSVMHYPSPFHFAHSASHQVAETQEQHALTLARNTCTCVQAAPRSH